MKTAGGQGALQTFILEQIQYAQNGIGPADHREVDADGDPEALTVGKGVGDFTKANGAGGVADEIECVEKRHRRSWQAGCINTGNKHQTRDRDGVDQDHDDQRCPHPAQDDEQNAVVGDAHRAMSR